MSEIILDFGSANTCKNSKPYIKRMIDELKAVDTGKHSIVIKWQLFQEAGQNIPLTHMAFDYAYTYATEQGYKTTASVFDIDSLEFLLKHNPCFVKIANRRDLDWLIGEVPRKYAVYKSISKDDEHRKYHFELYCIPMLCVSKYPATITEYENKFKNYCFPIGISDHTIGLELFRIKQPMIWEKHYKLPDSTGLDAGPFAITPEELKEVM